MICLIVTAERLLWLRRMNKENRQAVSAAADWLAVWGVWGELV